MSSTNNPSVFLSDAVRLFLRAEKAQKSPAQFAATSQTLHLFSAFLRDRYKISIHRVSPEQLSEDWGREFLIFLQEMRSIETEHLYSRAILQFYSYVKSNYVSTLDTDSLTNFIFANRRAKSHSIPDIPVVALQQIHAYAQVYAPPSHIEQGTRLYLQYLRDKAFLLALYDTGFRISEMCALRIHQANMSEGYIHSMLNIELPISPETLVALRIYLQQCNTAPDFPTRTDHSSIFARHDKRAGGRILPISRWTGANIVTFWVEQGLSQATRDDLEVTPQTITANTFRHYFVQRTLTNDLSLAETQTLARHQDIGTTRRYLKTLPEPTDE